MSGHSKIKKRGFVMTGGGAKGLYEAGVINAFHITGMEFDVITGSSIGAMNSIFFAEYLYQKHRLAAQGPKTPEALVDDLDDYVRAYHHAWLLMPSQKLIDDSSQGALGQVIASLGQLDLGLPLVTRLGWWLTDPNKGAIPPVNVWPGIVKLLNELANQIGPGELLNILRENPKSPIVAAARAYLSKHGMERSLIPEGDDARLKDLFVKPVSPLRPENLSADVTDAADFQGKCYVLVDENRTLGEYAKDHIYVRLTRANYRTGRLEISAAVSEDDFVRFMQKHFWRLQAIGPDKLPLGSFRLQVPGDPNAVNAGLCSGRFPGVFAPFPINEIYTSSAPENDTLRKLLANWLNDPDVTARLKAAYNRLNPGMDPQLLDQKFSALITRWRDPKAIEDFFPKAGDVYVDGGTIDNTPSNSAVDFTREWIDNQDLSRRDYELELFIIFLSVEPKIDLKQIEDPALFQVVGRTLSIQGVAQKQSDANTVNTINTFGNRAEEIGDALKVVLQKLNELDEVQRCEIEAQIYLGAKQANLDGAPGGYMTGDSIGLLERMSQWNDAMMKDKLPVQIEAIKIYPEEMPLDTLQFTERLRYKKENAIKMLTAGCYDTLWALRNHLEAEETPRDAQDEAVLKLARRWMGVETWPQEAADQAAVRETWRCQRTGCIYYEQYCAKGKG